MSREKSSHQKITVNDGIVDKSSSIKIKKERVPQRNKEEIREDVGRFYHKPFDHLEKPASLGGKTIFGLIILTLIIGFIAGALGSMFIFSRDKIVFPWGKEFNLTKYFPEKHVTEITEKNITVSSDIRINELTGDIEKSLVSIFPKKELKDNPSFLDQIYAPWQIKSMGLIISSDGWILTPYPFEEIDIEENAVEETENKKWEVIINGGEIYDLDKVIRDKRTGLTFIKINGNDLPFLELAPFSSINQGQTVLVADKFLRWYVSAIVRSDWRDITKTEDLVRSTDYFSESLLLNNISPNTLGGSFIFNLKGQLVGSSSSDNKKYIPSWQFLKAISYLKENKEIFYPSLGIDYLLIEEAPGLSSALFHDLKEGAIVYGNPTPGLAAYKAGIRNADVIIKFDGQNINKKNNLTYLVSQKSKGEAIHLTILRRGEEQDLTL
mgnify:FL=1